MGKFPTYEREFKYTSELSENEVYMLLGLPLGSSSENQPYIIGSIFAEEMYFWKQNGYDICLKINCPGGNIMDGFSIMDAVRECKAETQNIGVCASMAVPIFLCGAKRKAYDYSKMMIHPPMGENKPALEMMRDSLGTILKKLSNYAPDEVDTMLKDGAPDTWLNATEMEARGLINEIIPTEKQPEGAPSGDPYALYKVYNQLIQTEMAEKPKPGDEVQALTELKASMETINSQKAEIETLKKEIKDMKDAEALKVKNEATALVDGAAKDGKITIPEGDTALREQFIQMAIATPKAFAAIIAAKPAQATRQSVTNHMQINTEKPEQETYEWLANNDPHKLNNMFTEDPERFKKLEADFLLRSKLKTA